MGEVLFLMTYIDQSDCEVALGLEEVNLLHKED